MRQASAKSTQVVLEETIRKLLQELYGVVDGSVPPFDFVWMDLASKQCIVDFDRRSVRQASTYSPHDERDSDFTKVRTALVYSNELRIKSSAASTLALRGDIGPLAPNTLAWAQHFLVQ
jgi:hypothetical protein